MPYIGKTPTPAPLTSADLADNIIETATINDDAVTADKLANSINSEIAANTAKVTYPSADSTKLGGIEASADVTDATNVASAGAAMLTGAAFTGAVTTNSTFDGVDIATRDGVLTTTTTTAGAALPKAGGTMTGDTSHTDNSKDMYGAGNDLQIFHDGAHSNIWDYGTGDLRIRADNLRLSRSSDAELYLYATVDGDVKVYYNGAEKLATASGGVNITGDLTATGNVTAYSDLRLKSNIEVIDGALDKVKSLRGVTFDMNDKRSTGVIAQELEVVLPEAVQDNEDGMKSVAYGNTVGLLIEAIKELEERVKRLEE